jgi:hypothetical protein
MNWLTLLDNTAWLLIFDNVDREYSQRNTEPSAYDIKHYLFGAGHGSILITTWLTQLEQLGEPCVFQVIRYLDLREQHPDGDDQP